MVVFTLFLAAKCVKNANEIEMPAD